MKVTENECVMHRQSHVTGCHHYNITYLLPLSNSTTSLQKFPHGKIKVPLTLNSKFCYFVVRVRYHRKKNFTFTVSSRYELFVYFYNACLEQHLLHEIQRKQTVSHKVCSKCPPGRWMHVWFTFLTLSQFFHSRNVTAAWSADSHKTTKQSFFSLSPQIFYSFSFAVFIRKFPNQLLSKIRDCCDVCLFPQTISMITADILVVLGYRVKRSILIVFWYRQRSVHNLSSTHIFAKAYPPCSAVCLRQLTCLLILQTSYAVCLRASLERKLSLYYIIIIIIIIIIILLLFFHTLGCIVPKG